MRAAERAQRLLGTHRTPPYRASKEPKETDFSATHHPRQGTAVYSHSGTEEGERRPAHLSTTTFSEGGAEADDAVVLRELWEANVRTPHPEPDRGPSLLLRASAKSGPWHQ